MAEELTWAGVVDPASAWAMFVTGTDYAFDDFAWQRPEGVETRIVRGQHCHTRAELFREWSAALQVPYYFGHNWAAFDECVDDLEWIWAERLVVLVSRIDEVLAAEPDAFGPIFLRILGKHRVESSDGPQLVRFLLHSEHEAAAARLTAAGVELPARALPATPSR